MQAIQLNNPATIRAYFEKVRELHKSGIEFPVDLDDVWPLVYGRKSIATEALLKDWKEGVGFEVLQKNLKNSKGGRPSIIYKLSTKCFEYFIARKVNAVFEVYRQVFHIVADQADLAINAGPSQAVMTNDQIVASALRIVYGELQETKQRLDEANKNIERAAPKLAYVDKVLSTEEVIATTVIASEFGISAIRMNKLLHSLGIQRKVSDIWVLTTPFLGRGYTQMVTHLSEDREGRPHANELMYWTQRGRAFIHWKLQQHGYRPIVAGQQSA
jgi:phage antirepressor YoqD-like protein